MKRYFAYIRVSTIKQGEVGSSLQEQRAAIEGYARKNNLSILEWFEEKLTAAKLGRPVFTRMLKALDRGAATGVIIHKIDRSARNLRDWATLGDLLDRGIELHFAHESLDLNSRGGRLAADVQAVVAADFIRNLRQEVRKGMYGRLKQGLLPGRAPLGYLDQGGGKVKRIDPLNGRIVADAFRLYATGRWSLETLGDELYLRGLRNRNGGRVTRNGLSTMLNNSFYVGVIRLRSTGEVFQGVHEPIVSKTVFDRVESILRGRLTHKANVHSFRYQRTLRCMVCRLSLVAEMQKGHIYYRCHSRQCPVTSVREEAIDETLRSVAECIRIPDALWSGINSDVEALLVDAKALDLQRVQGLTLTIAAIDDRLARLTDAYVDSLIDQPTYIGRKEKLLDERAALVSRQSDIESGRDKSRNRIQEILELIKALGNMPDLPTEEELRGLLKHTTSNFGASGKNVVIAWANPFDQLFFCPPVTSGEPYRIKPRTFREKLLPILKDFIIAESKKRRRRGEIIEPPPQIKKLNPGAKNIAEFNRKRQIAIGVRIDPRGTNKNSNARLT